jgi:uncharacterized protein DUF6174
MTAVVSRRAVFASLLLAATTAGCLTSPDDADELSRQRRRWNSQGITDYRVLSQLICFCISDATTPVVLHVLNRRLVSVSRADDLSPVPPSEWAFRYYTIDEMFDLIADAQAKGASEVRVSYDPMLGYPTSVFLDMSSRVADDERQFELSGLTVAR